MDTARVLRPGEAVVVDSLGDGVAITELVIGLTTASAIPDLVAMLVGGGGRVRSDDDLVFYNNPASLDGAVYHQGEQRNAQWVRVVLSALDADVARVVLGCAGGVLDQTADGELSLGVFDGTGRQVAAATFTAESIFQAMILFEVYRRQGQWRCRLLAQGYAGGLAALVTEFGVSVEDDAPIDQLATGRFEAPDPLAVGHPLRADPSLASTPAPAPLTPQRHPTELLPAPSAALGRVDDPLASPTAYVAYAPHPPQSAFTSSAAGPPASWSAPPSSGRSRGLFTSRKRQQLVAQNSELHRLLSMSGLELQSRQTELDHRKATAAELEAQNAELNNLLVSSGAMDNVWISTERDRLAAEVAALAAEADRRRSDLTGLEQRLNELRALIAQAEGDSELVEVGVYRYRHRLDDSIAYKGRIDDLRDRIANTARLGNAVTGSTNWTVNGSLKAGGAMVKEVSKLMLRAYNADADHAVRTMRAYKLDSALTRLDTTRRTISRLGQTMSIEVSSEYHDLRRRELELTADYLSKVEEEKERQRQLREEQREQQRAEAEYQREQEKLERERQQRTVAIAQLEARGDTVKAEQLRVELGRVNDAIAGLESRRSNLRLGHVYVISNVGAFGERMVKIGMTRRLNPEDRIRELGDASVPFRFDKHALIFSEDAVDLETRLHQRFAAYRVNRVNAHREFFYVSPAEVRDALAELGSHYLLEYTEQIEAPEWRQSGGPERAMPRL